jgi:hypothetical protein
MSVYDSDHPRPKDELDAAGLRKAMAEASDMQIASLSPAEFRKVAGTALRVMTGGYPGPDSVEPKLMPFEERVGNTKVHKALIGRKGEKDTVPALGVIDDGFGRDTVVVWVHPRGKASLFEKGDLVPAAKQILAAKAGIFAIDAFGTGELDAGKQAVDAKFAGYTFGYNAPTAARQVHDILTAVAVVKDVLKAKTVHLVGWGSMGPAVVLARAQCGDAMGRTAVDLDQFRFENVKATDDPMMLPGALKYGGVPAFLGLCAPGEVLAHNYKGTAMGKLSKSAYDAAGASSKLLRSAGKLEAGPVVGWLLTGAAPSGLDKAD